MQFVYIALLLIVLVEYSVPYYPTVITHVFTILCIYKLIKIQEPKTILGYQRWFATG